jgi:hypothetical protein
LIRGLFNGRSENDIKNRWYSHLQFETVQEGGIMVLKSVRPQRQRRRRPVCDPKQNALKLLEQRGEEEEEEGGRNEELWDWKGNGESLMEEIDDFEENGFGE